MFAQQLRRHTSLNHLAQAAAAVLESPDQMAQMTIDWSRIDFENIRDQASWVCECPKADIMQNSMYQQLMDERFVSELVTTLSCRLTQRRLPSLFKWKLTSRHC